MSDRAFIGLFSFLDDAVRATEKLLESDFQSFEVYTPIPSHEIEHLLENRRKELHVSRVTAAGFAATALFVLLLAVGTTVLYPIQQSGMPLLPLPPIALSVAIISDLGAIIFTFLGFAWLAGLPSRRPKIRVPEISDDKFAIALWGEDPSKTERALAILNESGAFKVEEAICVSSKKRRADRKKGTNSPVIGPVAAFLAVLLAVVAYGPFWIWYNRSGFREIHEVKPKPQKTADPAYPKNSVSIEAWRSGTDSTSRGSAQTNPIPPTAESIERGKQVYRINCAVCHGNSGDGQGIMGSVPSLARLSELDSAQAKEYLSNFLSQSAEIDFDYIGSQADGVIFDTISYGFTNVDHMVMPSFRDALSPEERWDLVNYIKKGFK